MMTPQETQVLQDFLAQLTQVQSVAKEPQAASMIAAAVARQPDAAYLLVQRALLQDQALQAARAQIAQLQEQLQAERAHGSNASGGFLDAASAWGRSAVEGLRGGAGLSAPRTPVPAPAPAAPYPYPAAPAPQYAAPAASPGLFGGSGGSFLGNMAATAAGVAGGAFLFQGIENLLGHHHAGAGLLDQNAGVLPVESTTVNHFYGADNGGSGDATDTSFDDLGSNDDLGSLDDISSI